MVDTCTRRTCADDGLWREEDLGQQCEIPGDCTLLTVPPGQCCPVCKGEGGIASEYCTCTTDVHEHACSSWPVNLEQRAIIRGIAVFGSHPACAIIIIHLEFASFNQSLSPAIEPCKSFIIDLIRCFSTERSLRCCCCCFLQIKRNCFENKTVGVFLCLR